MEVIYPSTAGIENEGPKQKEYAILVPNPLGPHLNLEAPSEG